MTVKVTCSELPGKTGRARLADVSANGLSLILNNQMRVGSSVKVEWGRYSFAGISIYCQPRGREFLIGLKVEDPAYDKAKKFATQ
jgi:hypothetical protein